MCQEQYANRFSNATSFHGKKFNLYASCLDTTSFATFSRSHSRRALNGLGRLLRDNTSLLLTRTMKLPFPGFSGLTATETSGRSLVSSSMSFLADRPNTPQDLHASIITRLEDVGLVEISSRFLFGPISITSDV